MAISINQKRTIYRNLYENTGPAPFSTISQSYVREYMKVALYKYQ